MFLWAALGALLLMGIELTLNQTRFRQITLKKPGSEQLA